MQCVDASATYYKAPKRLVFYNNISGGREGHSDSRQLGRPAIDLNQARSMYPAEMLMSHSAWKGYK
jgi:hypothetical protein